MSIQSEITRITNKRDASFTAVANKGVTVPAGSTIDDLPDLISSISQGGSGTLVTKTITINGTYNAADDNADGYSSVTVAIPNGFTITDVSNTAGTTAQITGTNGVSTNHTIHLEFSDNTDTDIDLYYTDSVIGTIITSYSPSSWTYNSKTVTLAQLDNVTWYEPINIPIGVQLLDLTKITNDYVLDYDGSIAAQQYYAITDYTPIANGMSFSYTACRWFYLAFYDSSKTFISSIYIYNDTTESQYNANNGNGTLSGNEIPSNAAFIRLSIIGGSPSENDASLIRTA